MIFLIVAEKIHLDSLPMPEDDVELRVRGTWVIASVLLTIVGGIFVFLFAYIVQYLYQWIKK
jgi:hypothetical protein